MRLSQSAVCRPGQGPCRFPGIGLGWGRGGPARRTRGDCMTLVTYNLRSGGTGRSYWSRVREEFRPSIFLVQETAAPGEHLPPMFYPEATGRHAWERAEGRRWGSAIYAGRGETRPIELPDFHGHVVGLEVAGVGWPDG